MQVQRRVTAEQALADFVKLARASRLTADEHEHFTLQAQIITGDLQETRQALETLKAEHAKCASKPGSANPDGGAVGGQGNGANVGKDGSAVEPPVAVQESLQRSDEG